MEVWMNFVDLIYSTLVTLSTTFGGNMGLAIGVLSLSVRLALLPLTLRLARRAMETQAALKKLEPAIADIRKKYKDDPRRVWEETASLHQQHGIKILGGANLLGMLIQVPLFLGLFSAVKRGLSSSSPFLWIKDLMKSDPLLAGICAILTGLSAYWGSNVPESQRTFTAILPAALTFFFLWRMSAGVAVYSFSSSLVGVLQSRLLRRRVLSATSA
jgi:YidC/Oxa1 family membrane protein insertase